MKNHSNRYLLVSHKNSGPVPLKNGFPVEFHVSRTAREKYEFDENLFTSTGNVIFANFQSARLFAQRMNARRDLKNHPEQAVKAGHINAMGLIDELLHYVMVLYREQVNPKVWDNALEWLESKFERKTVDKTLRKFIEAFPPLVVYRGIMDAETYLQGETNDVSNRAIAMEEMLLLWLANQNPAFAPYLELFDDSELEQETVYLELMQSLDAFFETQPGFGPGKENLVKLLRLPSLKSPASLEEQLRFIRDYWGIMLDRFLLRLLGSLDFVLEEAKPSFLGPGPTETLEFRGYEYEHEPEKFSPDLHWMPRLVLLAKSTLVWLDQLSREYGREVKRLDQIPDEELDKLARWGITGLWLIGIWKRSAASKKIKQMCGNPEAESSAYSLFDYEIAPELGGFDAAQNLKDRCWQRGIRLACDMVPNHTGIDSKWVREHPDWFISLPYSPYPNYSFNGANLSEDPRYGIFIEDNYYNRTDAAVVFKRQDYWTGDVRYVYHGNDGTSMPWNDTAQLDYLKPEVREAVIQKILDVARLFFVIRFDAAMTLAKKHYQRLWYPEPGTGGDIPTRSSFGMTKDEFNQQIPNEFWREVVDRVAQEVPDTLLLAEAFWMMEGYFVRTLGMHRVYNSAFMNMLKNEENAKYRNTIKNTVQFNPEILKRYVNFMNNPDEETAVAQFGKDDKYFGVCILMVTMPGLPMIGHGQVEGFTEKYGMEYSKAYWDEQVDWGLVQRHEREVFPLMKKRYLFAEVDNFLLYDFFADGGHVNENVFAYSNRFEGERGLVLYNNKFEEAHGTIRMSAAYAEKPGGDGNPQLIQKTLGEGLALRNEPTVYCIFRDHISGLEYIRPSKELCDRGLHVELGAFKYQVFLDFREVQDNEWGHYGKLHGYLEGRGVPSIDEELKELAYKPVLMAFDDLFNKDAFEEFLENRLTGRKKTVKKDYLKQVEAKVKSVLEAAQEFTSGSGDVDRIAKETTTKLDAGLRLSNIKQRFPEKHSKKDKTAIEYLTKGLDDQATWSVLYSWATLHALGKIVDTKNFEEQSRHLLTEWPLHKRMERLFRQAGCEESRIHDLKQLIPVLVAQQNRVTGEKSKKEKEHKILSALLESQDVRRFLKVNEYEGKLWFNKERFEALCWWLYTVSVVQLTARARVAKEKMAKDVTDVYGVVQKWLDAEAKSEYQVGELLRQLQSPKKSGSKKSKSTKSKKSKQKGGK